MRFDDLTLIPEVNGVVCPVSRADQVLKTQCSFSTVEDVLLINWIDVMHDDCAVDLVPLDSEVTSFVSRYGLMP